MVGSPSCFQKCVLKFKWTCYCEHCISRPWSFNIPPLTTRGKTMHHLRWVALYVCLTLCLAEIGIVWAQGATNDSGTELGATKATTTAEGFNGNPVLPPKWAFGVLYGSYHDQAQVLSDMNQLRKN